MHQSSKNTSRNPTYFVWYYFVISWIIWITLRTKELPFLCQLSNQPNTCPFSSWYFVTSSDSAFVLELPFLPRKNVVLFSIDLYSFNFTTSCPLKFIVFLLFLISSNSSSSVISFTVVFFNSTRISDIHFELDTFILSLPTGPTRYEFFFIGGKSFLAQIIFLQGGFPQL